MTSNSVLNVEPSATSGGPANLRDVRGLRTLDGRIVRRGVLYRSEFPHYARTDGTDVPVWPPTTVIDLRAPEERGGGHPFAGVAAVHPVPLGASLAPTAPSAQHILDPAAAYRQVVRDAAAEIAHIAGLVAAAAPGPVLVHCTAGKDRTGIVMALLLRAVGVRRADVVADYLRTEPNLPRLWAALHAAGVPSPRNHVLAGVHAGALGAALDEVEAGLGNVRVWLAAHGATDAELERLADRLLTAVPAPVA
ncbi:tyrosine-protein phosphatase [Pseudonocardia nigra]|uniref:tyrosine-protein phosphatase n=1 Tax=Pseudonocardia nigra TaxID=1921578 RepID=UPI001C5CD182|nr:tyrosine-protein phosphatase [Pseudonocardia nigra]